MQRVINIDSWLPITEINFTVSWLVSVLFIELWFIFPTQNVELEKKYKQIKFYKEQCLSEVIKRSTNYPQKNQTKSQQISWFFFGNRTFPAKILDYTMHCKINCIQCRSRWLILQTQSSRIFDRIKYVYSLTLRLNHMYTICYS